MEETERLPQNGRTPKLTKTRVAERDNSLWVKLVHWITSTSSRNILACLALMALVYMFVLAGEEKGALETTGTSTLKKLETTTKKLETTTTVPKKKKKGWFPSAKKEMEPETMIPPPLVDVPPINETTRQSLSQQWGSWDPQVKTPTTPEALAAKYPHRDIPADAFPKGSFQKDSAWVKKYLEEAQSLVARARQAILLEYGYSDANSTNMFDWDYLDFQKGDELPSQYHRKGNRGNGGWTTPRSFQGLTRRLLHALVTSDTFGVVMAGHSAAAAEGNHFRQSYMMQFHKVVQPVLARLGVRLTTRNFGMGGLGTLHNGMGSGSIYGDQVDLLLWDSGMTEGGAHHIDLFYRQGLLGGQRVPVLWGGPFDVLKALHQHADVDIGEWGNALDGIPVTTSAAQGETLPWAARYMKCSSELSSECKKYKYCAKCWIERDDIPTPEGQRGAPGGQVGWHPGWRNHQLVGRNLAMAVLTALQSALTLWQEEITKNGQALPPDPMWHVTSYYDNIRHKLKTLDKAIGKCYELEGSLPTRMCNTPMKARTEYSPRRDPDQISITSILKPSPDGYVPGLQRKKLLYEGPDVPNPCFALPEGAVDVYAIVAGRRRRFLEQANPQESSNPPRASLPATLPISNRTLPAGIVPGRGWALNGDIDGVCDGSWNSICRRSGDCVLQGTHVGRGAVLGDGFSGWLVMELQDLKEGIIVLKLHTWHYASELPRTNGWISVNNESRRVLRPSTPLLSESNVHRHLARSTDTPDLPETFRFEYAIDGNITSLSKAQFLTEKKKLQRVVETITLLDDPDYTAEAKHVEVAIRMVGCGHECTFGVSHVYWA